MKDHTQTTHQSFGVVPEKAFREAESAPYGKATQILRQYDPLFGLVKDGQQVRRFSIECKQRKTVDEYCTVQVEALDEKQARDFVRSLPDEQFRWQEDYGSEDEDDFEITKVREIKE
jgi:hypothetical protein